VTGTGFVLVDKPRGPTSHDIVAKVRRAFGVKRVGHAGTLDPPATGLLVVAVGPATRLLRYVQGLPKTYDVTGVLGTTTTTLDADGEVVERRPIVGVTPERIRDAAKAFLGEIVQTPPAVSAVKVGGERAYKRAARGETVEIEPRTVTVYFFDVPRTSPDSFEARIVCSAGTYIRSIVADLGEMLGCGAHVRHLRRMAIGELDVSRATKVEDLGPHALRPVEEILGHMARLVVDAETEKLARNGRPIAAPAMDGETLVVGPSGVIGVFEPRDGMLRPVTVLGT
jgi:tRNA pseudouridine55 synthase